MTGEWYSGESPLLSGSVLRGDSRWAVGIRALPAQSGEQGSPCGAAERGSSCSRTASDGTDMMKRMGAIVGCGWPEEMLST